MITFTDNAETSVKFYVDKLFLGSYKLTDEEKALAGNVHISISVASNATSTSVSSYAEDIILVKNK